LLPFFTAKHTKDELLILAMSVCVVSDAFVCNSILFGELRDHVNRPSSLRRDKMSRKHKNKQQEEVKIN